jgi:hypothetical protein
VITAASAASFAESYRGLYVWAHNHGLADFWAAAFPLQVDSFIGVGELVLFVATVDRWTWRQRGGAWAVALLGLAVSIAGNIGHVAAHDAQSRGTAAVPPVAAFAALWLGLAVLKRVLARPSGSVPAAAGTAALVVLPGPAELLPAGRPETAPVPVPADAESAALIALRASIAGGNPISQNKLMERFGLTRAAAQRVRRQALAEANGHHPGAASSTAL